MTIDNILLGMVPTATAFIGNSTDFSVDCDGLGFSMVTILTIGDFRESGTGEIVLESTGEKDVIVEESDGGGDWAQVATFQPSVIRLANARTSHQLLFTRTKRYIRTRSIQVVAEASILIGYAVSHGDAS